MDQSLKITTMNLPELNTGKMCDIESDNAFQWNSNSLAHK